MLLSRSLQYITFVTAALFSHVTSAAAAPSEASVRNRVDASVMPVMQHHHIPGMAVGIIDGERRYFFDYGVASKQTQRPVTAATLFELGSISKTFTATLATYAQALGHLKLTDTTEKYLPQMQGTPFGKVALVHLGTHTPGGFPLQVPEEIKTQTQLMSYLQQWKPPYKQGTQRTYSNPGIGMLGLIAAKAMQQDFTTVMQNAIYAPLGLHDTYIDIPAEKMRNYAQGYTKQDAPARVSKAVLWAQAYGAKSTSRDMLRFVQANMNMIVLDNRLQKAVTDTHIAYARTAAMTQDLIWEHYPYPVTLQALLKGNSAAFALQPQPVTPVVPAAAPRDDVWMNKTGSTNGFGAYVAFIPARKQGIVLLANKNYPIEDRIKIAYEILSELDARTDEKRP